MAIGVRCRMGDPGSTVRTNPTAGVGPNAIESEAGSDRCRIIRM